LIYDSHEYFTETPELVNRPFVQGTWKLLERAIVPRLDEMITVNESIARLFSEKYGIKVHVVRNIPPRLPSGEIQSKAAMGLPDGKHLLVMQGSGINIQRGAEELVEAMRFVDKSVLLIIGGGDVLPVLKRMVADYKLEEKVLFFPRMPFHQLMQYTRLADLGFTLDKNTNINYRFSLPNKLFDFIQAGVPVVASRLPEVMKIVDEYQIGTYIDQHDPTHIAAVINRSLADTSEMQRWKNNLSFAAPKLCWENEEKVLLNLYAKYA
jgi:glycosyltransferase involved in cell wall biosynthesis